MLQAEVITRERMFEPLLRADPTFEPTWRAFLAEWEHEPDQQSYLALADLARHLIGQLERGDTTRFEAVFDVVEQWHLRGDKYVRDAASVGLLEDLQNTNFHKRTTQRSDFIPWLRPTSRRWWDKVERFWSHGELIMDD